MGSSREYWQYAKECARWAADAKETEEQKLLLEMAKAWTNIALVETDVAKQSALEGHNQIDEKRAAPESLAAGPARNVNPCSRWSRRAAHALTATETAT